MHIKLEPKLLLTSSGVTEKEITKFKLFAGLED